MKKSLLLLGLLWAWSSIGLLAQTSLSPTPNEPCSIFARPPVPTNLCTIRKSISYPERAHRAEIEGIVQVRVEVDERGNYQRHEIVQSSHPILSEALTSGIPLLEFSPALQEGKAVPGCIFLPFIFRLRGAHGQTAICPKPSPEEGKKIASQEGG